MSMQQNVDAVLKHCIKKLPLLPHNTRPKDFRIKELVGLYHIYLTKTCQIYSISCIFVFLYNETAILSFSKRIHTKCVCLVFSLT